MPETDITQRLEGYKRLIEIARDLASTLDLDILLKRIVQAASDITRAEAGSILLYDDVNRELYFQVATNLATPLMHGLNVPLEGSIAGWVVTNRKPVRIANVHEDPRHYDIEAMTKFTTHSLLGVPLITKEKVVGVLEVLNKRGGDFTETDQDLLTVLAAQAAVVIENARLFKQSDLIAEFVHELRTPLASIGTATYLLLRPEMSLEQREQIILNIHNETSRLNSLTSSFLDLARLESGRVQYHISRFDLRELMEECRVMMQSRAQESHISVDIKAPLRFPQVDADREKIKQVLINMLSNAIKYNRPNGKVVMEIAPRKKEVTIFIQDNGIGIPPEALPHLFEKFYRVRCSEDIAMGTGLGLSICKQIVQGHGGTIDVKSKPGEGTTFIIYLPRGGKQIS